VNRINHLTKRHTILVVDDTPDNLSLVSSLLRDDYTVKVANNGEKALKVVDATAPPDLILLDVMMPGIDGHEVCRRLKSDPKTRDIPVIFLTARADVEDERKGFELGAVDYVTKPINPPTLLGRVKAQLGLKVATDFLRDQNDSLEDEVAKRTQELISIQDVTILAMASLAETRDSETGNHIQRTQHYVKVLAEQLRAHPRFSAFLTDQNIMMLFKSAPLHDIGKVGIPDRILLKPARLDADEFEIMKGHAALGCEAIVHAEKTLGVQVEFLRIAKEIAMSHHERWDGSGYPEGLSGEAIPVSARLMALADVYDALISRRVYKSEMPHEQAVATILKGRGTHFDPDMLDAFVVIQDQLLAIATRFQDAGGDTLESP